MFSVGSHPPLAKSEMDPIMNQTTLDRYKQYVIANYTRYPVCLVRGEGSHVWDDEGRRYLGLKRHLILSSVSYLFLAQVRQEWAGEKPTADGVPTAHGDGGAGALVVAGAAGLGTSAGEDGREDQEKATEQRPRAPKPHESDAPEVERVRHSTYSVASEQLELAL